MRPPADDSVAGPAICGGGKLVLRPFGESDHLAVEAIAAAVDADYPWADEWHAGEQYSAGDGPFRWVVEAEREPVVASAAMSPARPPRHRLRLMVLPRWQRRGAGRMLYHAALSAAHGAEAATLQARVRKTQQDALGFLFRRGFEFVHEMVGMRLDVTRCELGSLVSAVAQVRSHGIEIRTLAQEQACEPQWLARFRELVMAVREGWPEPDPGPPLPWPPDYFEQTLKPAIGHEESVYIAKSGDRYIGYSGMPFLATAVVPAYRNRGVATALKVLAIGHAKACGATTLLTCTASAAMAAVNAKFGFVPYCTEVRLRKIVRGFQSQ